MGPEGWTRGSEMVAVELRCEVAALGPLVSPADYD